MALRLCSVAAICDCGRGDTKLAPGRSGHAQAASATTHLELLQGEHWVVRPHKRPTKTQQRC
eukprot:9555461-Alexandrium_andersonii.AAC.1